MNQPREKDHSTQTTETRKNEAFEKIQSAVESIRYGTVQIHIQDGRIVQIDKVDKIRLR